MRRRCPRCTVTELLLNSMAAAVGLDCRISDQAMEEDEASKDEVVKVGAKEGVSGLCHSNNRGVEGEALGEAVMATVAVRRDGRGKTERAGSWLGGGVCLQ